MQQSPELESVTIIIVSDLLSVNDALGQDIKGAAKQNIIGRGSEDMDLQVKHDVVKSAGDVTC